MRRRPDVTLTQLRYFVKAATYSSMTKAADELHIAQSAVSAAISQLEQQIGTQLFIRHRARGLALTSAGEDMLRDTRALLAHLDEVLDGASGHVDQVRGTVRLACFTTLTPFVIPKLLVGLGVDFPDLDVHVLEADTDTVKQALENGQAELAIGYDFGYGEDFDTRAIGYAEPYLTIPGDHRLAGSERVSLDELRDEDLVLLDIPQSREYFLGLLGSRGITPRVRYRSKSYETVRALVARGLGYSVLNQRPTSGETYDGGRVAAVAIDEDLPPLPIVLIRLKAVRLTARARAVADAITRSYIR